MANTVPSGLNFTFEEFCVLAQLEPQEIAGLRRFAGSGERPLRGWIQTLSDGLGLRLPREPLDGEYAGGGGTPVPGPAGTSVQAAGLDEYGHLIINLSDGRSVDAGLVKPMNLEIGSESYRLGLNADGYVTLLPGETS